MKDNLIKRILSAIVFLVIFSLGIFVHEILFVVFFQIIMTIAIIEFFNFGKQKNFKPYKIFGILFSILFFTYIYLFKNNIVDLKYIILLPAILLLPMIFELYKKESKTIENISVTILAIIYIVLPFSLLNFLVFPKVNDYQYTYKLIFGLFFLIWTFDSGAYFSGSLFGKHKLFERISPKKTWEGVIGGYLVSIGISYVIFLIFKILTPIDWIIISIIVSTLSIFGDLVESHLKRYFNLKDSGKIMPGHGGILDRIDSSLFAIPFVVIYLFLQNII